MSSNKQKQLSLQLPVSGWNKKIRGNEDPAKHQLSTTKLHGVTSNRTTNFDSIVVWYVSTNILPPSSFSSYVCPAGALVYECCTKPLLSVRREKPETLVCMFHCFPEERGRRFLRNILVYIYVFAITFVAFG